MLALAAGEVDYLLNPLGMQRGLLAQVEGNEELTAVVNPTNGFRYLAFNLRKEPMSIPAFRDALALMIDKEFMANNVLQGVAFPLYATVPEGNTKWYNAEAADRLRVRVCRASPPPTVWQKRWSFCVGPALPGRSSRPWMRPA